MNLTRRSLFAMLLAAPLVKLLPKSKRIGVLNGDGDVGYLVSLPHGAAPQIAAALSSDYAQEGMHYAPFVNSPAKNWAKHLDDCWLAQPSWTEKERAWLANTWREIANESSAQLSLW